MPIMASRSREIAFSRVAPLTSKISSMSPSRSVRKTTSATRGRSALVPQSVRLRAPHLARPLPEVIAYRLRGAGEVVLGRCAEGERRLQEPLSPERDVALGVRDPQRPDHPRRAGHQSPGQTCLACASPISWPASTTTPPREGFTRIVSHSFRVFSTTCARSSAVSGA